MKYVNFHEAKPEVNRLIYWMGPNMTDILGWFRGNCQFHEVEKKHPGYIPKWWYYAEEHLNIPDPLFKELIPEEPKKRGRKPKVVEEDVQQISEPEPIPVLMDRMVQVIKEDEQEGDEFDGEFF
jgi:hypothetical protein